MDPEPNPGGPKTCGSGFGSGAQHWLKPITLLGEKRRKYVTDRVQSFRRAFPHRRWNSSSYLGLSSFHQQRPARGPLLTVETEANGDSWCSYERGPSLVGPLGSFFSFPGCSSQPSIKLLFSSPDTCSLY